jgi:hypothetical protein
MKIKLIIFVLLQSSLIFAQQPTPLQELKAVFTEYVKYPESVDEQEDKDRLILALKKVEEQKISNCIPVIIDIYLYYDPTDFPTRDLVIQTLKPLYKQAFPLITKRIAIEKKKHAANEFPVQDLEYLVNSITPFINPSGNYILQSKPKLIKGITYGYSGEISVSMIDSSHIAINLLVSKAPSYSSGSIDDTLTYNYNKAVYTTPEDPSCKIIFNFTTTGINAEHKAADFNASCGFGHGVAVHGFYRKNSVK